MTTDRIPLRVLLLTSTNLTANPRSRKELELLADMGVSVHVVAFHLPAWTDNHDRSFIEKFPTDRFRFHYLHTTRQRWSSWLLLAIGEKLGRVLSPFFPFWLLCASASVSKRSLQLLHWRPPKDFRPDLVIAHNPAAFYPASFFAQKWSVPFALDVEDYHPGENIAPAVRNASGRLMDKLLDRAAYVSYASPLIREKAMHHVKRQSGNHFVVNNVFPSSEFIKRKQESVSTSKLKLVWFSQFVDYGRGIEHILPVLDRFADYVQLTLIGSCRPVFRNQELVKRDYLDCVGPLSQTELHRELGCHDIGLAIEDSNEDLNRNLCLTNKIWAYFQSGLYILATDTAAQRDFIRQFPNHGRLTSMTPERVSETLDFIIANRKSIQSGYDLRFANAQQLGWELEGISLKTQWRKILDLPGGSV